MYTLLRRLGAAVMAANITSGKRWWSHPRRTLTQAVLRTYADCHGIEIVERDANNPGGQRARPDTACVIVQQPNYLGEIRDLKRAADKVHEAGAILIIVFARFRWPILKAPESTTLISHGRAEPRHPMSFWWALLGLFATKENTSAHAGDLPYDQRVHGKRASCSPQTPRAHSRREKAPPHLHERALIAWPRPPTCVAWDPQASSAWRSCRCSAATTWRTASPSCPATSSSARAVLQGVRGPDAHLPTEFEPPPPEHKIIGGLDISGTKEVDGQENVWLLAVTEMNSKEHWIGW